MKEIHLKEGPFIKSNLKTKNSYFLEFYNDSNDNFLEFLILMEILLVL